MAILIDTAAVSNAAGQIDRENNKIRDELSDIESAIRMLQRNWEGSAADACANAYEYIKKDLADNRFLVVNQVVSFMRMQVGENYKTTETTISTAASAFK